MEQPRLGYFTELYGRQFKPFNKMKREDIEKELEQFRNLWTWMDEELRAFLCHIRYPVILVRRDYKKVQGLMGAPHFELKSLDVDVQEEVINYTKGQLTIETKTVTIPINQLVDYEFIHAQEVMPIPKQPWEESPEEKGKVETMLERSELNAKGS